VYIFPTESREVYTAGDKGLDCHQTDEETDPRAKMGWVFSLFWRLREYSVLVNGMRIQKIEK